MGNIIAFGVPAIAAAVTVADPEEDPERLALDLGVAVGCFLGRHPKLDAQWYL